MGFSWVISYACNFDCNRKGRFNRLFFIIFWGYNTIFLDRSRTEWMVHMSERKVAREFWIETGSRYGLAAYTFKSVNPEGEQIHVLEVLPPSADVEKIA